MKIGKNKLYRLIAECINESVDETNDSGKKYYATVQYFQFDTEEFDNLREAGEYDKLLDYIAQWDEGGENEFSDVSTRPDPYPGDDVLAENGEYVLVYNARVGGTYDLRRVLTQDEFNEEDQRTNGRLSELLHDDEHGGLCESLRNGLLKKAVSMLNESKKKRTVRIKGRKLHEMISEAIKKRLSESLDELDWKTANNAAGKAFNKYRTEHGTPRGERARRQMDVFRKYAKDKFDKDYGYSDTNGSRVEADNTDPFGFGALDTVNTYYHGGKYQGRYEPMDGEYYGGYTPNRSVTFEPKPYGGTRHVNCYSREPFPNRDLDDAADKAELEMKRHRFGYYDYDKDKGWKLKEAIRKSVKEALENNTEDASPSELEIYDAIDKMGWDVVNMRDMDERYGRRAIRIEVEKKGDAVDIKDVAAKLSNMLKTDVKPSLGHYRYAPEIKRWSLLITF